MERRKSLENRILVCILCLGLLGCQKEVVQVEQVTEEPTATQEPTPTPTPIVVNHTTIQESTLEIVDSFIHGRNVEASSSFKDAQEDIIKEVKGCTITDDQFIITNERKGKIVVECNENKKLMVVELDEELLLSSIHSYSLLSAPTLEDNDIFYEIPIEVGLTPKLNGVLTIPYETEYPSVAILMPNGFYNNCDGSGDDETFRKDLAHALATEGIAVVRYDMRLANEPSIIQTNEDYNLNEIYFKDFASCVHQLEKYPVDAGDILFVGHGLGGSLAYTSVYHHFEITGGIVLIDPIEESGLDLMNEVYELPKGEIDKVLKELEKKEPKEKYTYPLSFYKEWIDTRNDRYFQNIRQRILILKSHTLTTEEKTEYNGHYNIIVKGYPIRTDSFRVNDTLYEKMPSDIFSWILGIDILK